MKTDKVNKQITTNELLRRMDEGFNLMKQEFVNVRLEMKADREKSDAEFARRSAEAKADSVKLEKKLEADRVKLEKELKADREKSDAEFARRSAEAKADNAKLEKKLKADRERSDDKFTQFMFYLQGEFAEIHRRLDEMLPRKEFLEWVCGYDDSLKEVREVRQNRLLFENQFVELDDTVADHGKRIVKLEKANAES